MMSCAAYSSELMLMREGSRRDYMYRKVWVWMGDGHSRYHQKAALRQYPPKALRLESLCAVPKGTLGIRRAMGQDLWHQGFESAVSMRRRSRRRLWSMKWAWLHPWIDCAVSPV